jgi:hypothetical protein
VPPRARKSLSKKACFMLGQELLSTGIVGLKSFMSPSGINDFGQSAPAHVAAAIPVLAKTKRPLMVHAELPPQDPPAPAGKCQKRPRPRPPRRNTAPCWGCCDFALQVTCGTPGPPGHAACHPRCHFSRLVGLH